MDSRVTGHNGSDVDERASNTAGNRVFLETFGCQMNLLDTELVDGELRAHGYERVVNADDADIVLYNTCSVRELSEHKVLSRLGRMKQRKRTDTGLIVGILGCMAERKGAELLAELPHLDVVVGPSELDKLPGILGEIRGRRAARGIALSGHTARRSSTMDAAMDRLEALDRGRLVDPDVTSTQAYVRITRGCNKFCSFCVVPYTRGAEVHRPPDAIVDEVRSLAQNGAKEVTLLGQTINHYAFENTSFAELLRRVHDEVPELPRLRFLTSYPRDFTDEALDVMAQSERMSRFLHIPAQHGNDDVLKRMNRGYTRGQYLDLIRRARDRMPDVAIVGDMIVGFPGETDDDFEMSLSLVREVQYKTVYVFKYSPREGTVAEKRLADDVPDDVKKARNNTMLQLQQEISERHHRAMIGSTIEVLVEGTAKIDPANRSERSGGDDGDDGLITLKRRAKPLDDDDTNVRLTARTRGDHIVAFNGPSSIIGALTNVRITDATGLSLRGEHVGA